MESQWSGDSKLASKGSAYIIAWCSQLQGNVHEKKNANTNEGSP